MSALAHPFQQDCGTVFLGVPYLPPVQAPEYFSSILEGAAASLLPEETEYTSKFLSLLHWEHVDQLWHSVVWQLCRTIKTTRHIVSGNLLATSSSIKICVSHAPSSGSASLLTSLHYPAEPYTILLRQWYFTFRNYSVPLQYTIPYNPSVLSLYNSSLVWSMSPLLYYPWMIRICTYLLHTFD